MKQFKKFLSIKVYLWVVLLSVLALIVAGFYGYFKASTRSSEQNVSTYSTVKKLEKVGEVVLLNVEIQKVKTISEDTKIFGQKVLASEKKAIIILNYTAKFGIKEDVKIERVGGDDHAYRVTIPKYQTIGTELNKKNPYQLYHESKEFLSAMTKDVDTGEAVAESLSDEIGRAHV